jgi:magnesium-transporting ATPase (P-type)
MNNRLTKVLDHSSGEVMECKWQELKAGDIVKVEKD